jgi:hypothetical protein
MASTAVPTSRRAAARSESARLSRKEAAQKIIALIECDMTKKELAEIEKNKLAKQFVRAVDGAIAARRKS